tara:strand:- start:3756 stop:4178 length:423 start_codon:yes stop_codon:yes gene_type:complete
MLDKIDEFYEFYNNTIEQYMKCIKIDMTDFKEQYKHDILSCDEFISNYVINNNDYRETYETRKRRHDQFMKTVNRVSNTEVYQQSAEYVEYMQEEFYLDDLKDFGKLNSALLSFYNEEFEGFELGCDKVLECLKNDPRFQ